MNSRVPQPCDIPSNQHDGEVRFYLTGWKCDHHSPWAAKGLPRPAPGPRAIYTYRAAQAADTHHTTPEGTQTMSTRGFLGFVADQHETITYVHFDAYPSGLGADVLKWARTVTDWDAVRQQAAALAHVDAGVMPTDEQRAALAAYMQPGVGGSKDDPGEEWYRLLHGTFGNPEATLAAGHAPHAPDWPGDSVWCEWGYLIDLDEKKFEVYQGFQTAPHKGRFADRPANERSGYYPVKLLISWPLDGLPDDDEFYRLGDGD